MSKFYEWMPEITENSNILSDSEFSNLNERANGFLANTIVKSKNVNSVIRSSSIVTAALMDLIDEDSDLDISSTKNQVKYKIETFFDDITPIATTNKIGGVKISSSLDSNKTRYLRLDVNGYGKIEIPLTGIGDIIPDSSTGKISITQLQTALNTLALYDADVTNASSGYLWFENGLCINWGYKYDPSTPSLSQNFSFRSGTYDNDTTPIIIGAVSGNNNTSYKFSVGKLVGDSGNNGCSICGETLMIYYAYIAFGKKSIT